MVYDTKNRVLHMGVYEKIKLTNYEHKLLICLSSEMIVTYEEIIKFLYSSTKPYAYVALRNLVMRFINKTKNQIKIKTIFSIGYRLETEIYFK